jgi:hypothetical protein
MGDNWGGQVSGSQEMYNKDPGWQNYNASGLGIAELHTWVSNQKPAEISVLADQFQRSYDLLVDLETEVRGQSQSLYTEKWTDGKARDAFMSKGPGAVLAYVQDWQQQLIYNVTALRSLVGPITTSQHDMDDLWARYGPAIHAAGSENMISFSDRIENGLPLVNIGINQGPVKQFLLDRVQKAQDEFDKQARQIVETLKGAYHDAYMTMNSAVGHTYTPPNVMMSAPGEMTPYTLLGAPGAPGAPGGPPVSVAPNPAPPPSSAPPPALPPTALAVTAPAPGGPPGANPGAPPGANPGAPPGANPGLPPGANPGLPPGANPGLPPGLPPGANPGLPPGANPGLPPGGLPGGLPGAIPGLGTGTGPGLNPGLPPGASGLNPSPTGNYGLTTPPAAPPGLSGGVLSRAPTPAPNLPPPVPNLSRRRRPGDPATLRSRAAYIATPNEDIAGASGMPSGSGSLMPPSPQGLDNRRRRDATQPAAFGGNPGGVPGAGFAGPGGARGGVLPPPSPQGLNRRQQRRGSQPAGFGGAPGSLPSGSRLPGGVPGAGQGGYGGSSIPPPGAPPGQARRRRSAEADHPSAPLDAATAFSQHGAAGAPPVSPVLGKSKREPADTTPRLTVRGAFAPPSAVPGVLGGRPGGGGTGTGLGMPPGGVPPEQRKRAGRHRGTGGSGYVGTPGQPAFGPGAPLLPPSPGSVSRRSGEERSGGEFVGNPDWLAETGPDETTYAAPVLRNQATVNHGDPVGTGILTPAQPGANSPVLGRQREAVRRAMERRKQGRSEPVEAGLSRRTVEVDDQGVPIVVEREARPGEEAFTVLPPAAQAPTAAPVTEPQHQQRNATS